MCDWMRPGRDDIAIQRECDKDEKIDKHKARGDINHKYTHMMTNGATIDGDTNPETPKSTHTKIISFSIFPILFNFTPYLFQLELLLLIYVFSSSSLSIPYPISADLES